VSVDERVDAGSGLDSALDDALVVDIDQVVVEGCQDRGGAVLLDISGPCGRGKASARKSAPQRWTSRVWSALKPMMGSTPGMIVG
jgi:hypothetical protein